MKLSLSLTTILAVISATQGFSPLSRRESFAKVASSIVGGGAVAAGVIAVPNAAIAYPAEETPKVITRMGGLLVSSK